MSSELTPAQHAALDAEYEIIRELGRGGTAVVYLAIERATGAEVAIKLIRPRYAADEEALGRLAREARLLTLLKHQNIVPMHAVVDLGNGAVGLVMAHVAGETLRQVIRGSGRLSPERAERIMRDIGHALEAAHAMGIVHRDVKPENIFIDDDDRAVLADFGLARSMTADTQLTMSGVAIGTPAYMAPEQIESGELDARGDVYSLGLVGWEMLTGHRPWDGQSLYSVLYHQKHEHLPDVRDLRDDVSDRLANVILRAIEKDRDARWQTMRAMLKGLDAASPEAAVKRTQVSLETTRFVRPPTPPTPATPERPITPVTTVPPAYIATDQTLRDIADELEGRSPWRRPSDESPASRHKFAIGVVAVALVAIASLATAAMRGRSAETLPEPPKVPQQPFVAADVPKPVQMGVVDSTAFADSVKHSVHDTITTKTRVVSNGATVAVQPPVVAAKPAPQPAKTPAPPARIVNADTDARSSARGSAPAPTPPVSAPPRAPAPAAVNVSVVAGGMHTCFKNAEGRAFCWGNNDRGQIGSGSAARTAAPLPVASEGTFATMTAGLSHSCGITRDGAAWCWGNNDHGQLGDRSTANRSAPVRVASERPFRSIVAGAAHTCGLDSAGMAWCWGSNARGQLGDTIARDSGLPVPAGGGETRFVSLVAGWNFTCGVGTNGQASCWGENTAGQLGDSTTSSRNRPSAVRLDIAFTALAAGSAHACGVTTQGDVYCWGRNTYGQLGDGTTADRTTPVRVRGASRFSSITAGAVHTCALADDGSAQCWGRNTYGQLGNGSDTDVSQPARVAGGHTFGSVHAFGSHTCGATASGQAYCWGYNLEGQLGDGTRIHRTRPVFVETPSGARRPESR